MDRGGRVLALLGGGGRAGQFGAQRGEFVQGPLGEQDVPPLGGGLVGELPLHVEERFPRAADHPVELAELRAEGEQRRDDVLTRLPGFGAHGGFQRHTDGVDRTEDGGHLPAQRRRLLTADGQPAFQFDGEQFSEEVGVHGRGSAVGGR